MKSIRERWKAESKQMVPTDPSRDTKKSFEIYKTDEDQHLVFGWASVAITVDGNALEDRQHDMIDPADLEEAAYEYVLNFRETGEEHLPGYRKKGRLVESCVFTPEKQRAMGIPEGTLPVAWWIGFKIDDEETWQRVKNGTYKMFSIEGRAQREPIEKADRTAQTFEEVLKFNPFHDALGRFSSASGMKTYSANPKTRAGQLAIGRSAPNHGSVMNVHRESKGENIRQNEHWIKTGQKPKVPAAQDAGSGQSKPKVTTKPKTQAKPKKPANDAQSASADPVKGEDIVKSFKQKLEQYPSGNFVQEVNQVADQQGYLGKPQVVSRKEFDAAVKESGIIGYRTVHDGTDIVSGKKTSAQQFADDMMYGDKSKISLNGGGGQAFGGGIYMATNSSPKKGTTPSETAAGSARNDSALYGYGNGDRQMQITFSPKAKVGDYAKVYQQFLKEPSSIRQKFGGDVGAYAAAKGYDALRAKDGGWGCDYTMVYNRTALIFCDDVYDPNN